MLHNTKEFVRLLGVLVLLILVGCGGGAGNSLTGAVASAGRSAVDVYVTDSFNDAYKQVQLTLYKIELTTDGTNFQTVYEDTSGQTLNLCSLATAAELLASVNIPTGTYTQARVTFGDHITLVANDGTTSSVAVDTSVGVASGGKIAVTVATPAKVTSGQLATVVIDFKLAEFKLVGSVLRPQIGHGDETMLRTKSRSGHLQGTVANLTAGVSFDLQEAHGRTVSLLLTDATTIVSGQTGSAITLANGQSVFVDGTFDASTNKFTATTITLNDYTTFPRESVNGTVASVNASAGSFVLTVQRAEGIQPTSGTITVQTDANTRYAKGRHTAGSLSDITVGSDVMVNGSFDSMTQTLMAKCVRLP